MITLAAILALVSVPYALDTYFNSPEDAEPTQDE